MSVFADEVNRGDRIVWLDRVGVVVEIDRTMTRHSPPRLGRWLTVVLDGDGSEHRLHWFDNEQVVRAGLTKGEQAR